jgi:hypothetical protein
MRNQRIQLVYPQDKEMYQCTQCSDLLDGNFEAAYAPSQLACGHRYCHLCLKSMAGNHCPGDEADCVTSLIAQARKDRGIQRDVGKLMVFCTNREQGCMAEVMYKDLTGHLCECNP